MEVAILVGNGGFHVVVLVVDGATGDFSASDRFALEEDLAIDLGKRETLRKSNSAIPHTFVEPGNMHRHKTRK